MDSEKLAETARISGDDGVETLRELDAQQEEFSLKISERKLLFKIDCWVLPILSFLFFLSFLDK